MLAVVDVGDVYGESGASLDKVVWERISDDVFKKSGQWCARLEGGVGMAVVCRSQKVDHIVLLDRLAMVFFFSFYVDFFLLIFAPFFSVSRCSDLQQNMGDSERRVRGERLRWRSCQVREKQETTMEMSSR